MEEPPPQDDHALLRQVLTALLLLGVVALVVGVTTRNLFLSLPGLASVAGALLGLRRVGVGGPTDGEE